MRTVYVDVLAAVNLFIDLLLLLCTKRFLKLRASLKRLVLASAIGGVLSLAALLPPLPFWLNLPLDALGAALLVFAAFGKTDFKSFIKRTAVFFAASFSFCGVMVFVYTAFRPKGMAVYNDVVYFNISPLLLIILTLVCYYTMRLLQKLTKGRVGHTLCSVRLTAGGKAAEFCAMIDTGCDVKEPFSGKPVMIVERSCLEAFELANFQKRIIPFHSLGGKGILEGFQAESAEIDGQALTEAVYIGVCENLLKGDVKAIVPYEIVR